MTASAQQGPLIVYGSRSSNVAEATGASNPSLAPSLFIGGTLFLDPRAGYNTTRTGAIGLGQGLVRVAYLTPTALGAAKIAALANVSTGVAMTLAVASTGITVNAAATRVWASGNLIPVNALVIEGFPVLSTFNELANPSGGYAVSGYNPTLCCARALSVTGVSGGAGGAFLVSGADIYGYPMTETITAAAGVATTNGKKAFKFVYSVTPQFTDAHNYSVGTTDIFGFPMRAANFSEALINYNSTLITANTGFVAADTTSPATATTGDVRGTYAVQSASDGTKTLALFVSPQLSTIVTAAGLFGVSQQ